MNSRNIRGIFEEPRLGEFGHEFWIFVNPGFWIQNLRDSEFWILTSKYAGPPQFRTPSEFKWSPMNSQLIHSQLMNSPINPRRGDPAPNSYSRIRLRDLSGNIRCSRLPKTVLLWAVKLLVPDSCTPVPDSVVPRTNKKSHKRTMILLNTRRRAPFSGVHASRAQIERTPLGLRSHLANRVCIEKTTPIYLHVSGCTWCYVDLM